MQPQRPVDDAAIPSQDDVSGVVLSILLQRYPALMAVDELLRELSEPTLSDPVEEVLIHDLLRDLIAIGLVHRLDTFVFPTITAWRASQLHIG